MPVLGQGQRRRLSVLGHLGAADAAINGQVMRTRVVFREFQKRLGEDATAAVDTSRLTRSPLATFWQLRSACQRSDHLVIMPGERGLRYLVPHYLRWQKASNAQFHFLVVGGWLPDFLSARNRLCDQVRELGPLYVQTRQMLQRLRDMGLERLHLLPNFRAFPELSGIADRFGPLRLVFYSRVTADKGVEQAIDAVCKLQPSASLDIWGPVEGSYRERLFALVDAAGDRIRYRGVLDEDRIYRELPQYDALVFPTTYEGEGFPGAILDAFSCGLPVIASDWRYNSEFVQHNVNGALVAPGDQSSLDACLAGFAADPGRLRGMSPAALASAQPYHVDRVFPELMRTMGLCP